MHCDDVVSKQLSSLLNDQDTFLVQFIKDAKY